MNPMYLSIITVTLNSLQGLKQTMDSIKSQNICHAQMLEWIVIDGGSTDGTLYFLQNLCLKFPFAFKFEKDRGVFDAMNKGISLSSGKSVLFLNSGDIFASVDVLTKLSIYLSAEPPRIISGLVEMTYKSSHKISDLKPWVCHQSVFVPRALLVEYMFDETLKYFGDLDLWKRLAKDGRFDVLRLETIVSKFECGGIGNSPEKIFNRLRERSLVSVRHKDKIPFFIRLLHSTFLFLIYRLTGRDGYYKYLLK
jgi:putative colanic acid biosynthesis glycosyltransferase